jgi:peptidoglycan/LPS O-acetylase OafA/YrhL
VWFAQALRGVACLIVVVHHYADYFVCCQADIARICLVPPLTGLPRPACLGVLHFFASWGVPAGQFGVSLFFLVSGFVIPYSLGRHTPGGFFVRRFFRLYPTLWVVQALVLCVLALNARWFGTHFPFTPAPVLTNAFLLNRYLRHPFIEPVCWTLLVEEVFYAVCAACAWRGVLDRPRAVGLLALALTAGGFIRYRGLGEALGYVLFLFVGVVLHHLHRGTWRPRVGLPLVLVLLAGFALSCFCGALVPPGGVVAFRCALAALAVFAPLLLLDRRLPHVAWLDALAEISYPLYLAHATLGYVVLRAAYLAWGNLSLAMAAAGMVAVGLAVVLHHGVELPGNALGRWAATRLAGRGGPEAPARRAA